jgi:predicted Zn-dependent protease
MKQALATLLILLATSACVSSATGRRQLLLISPAQEHKLGAQAFDELRAKERPCANPAAAGVVRDIGRRIAAVSPQPRWGWTFELFDAPQTLNAFALPGGKVGVYTGLFAAAGNAAGLAAVMGHEVAHAILRHGAERVSQGLVVQMGVEATGIAFENSAHKKTILAALGLGAQLGVMLPYSREMESEADVIGLQYMARAGYDPREAVAFWERFRKATGGAKTPELLSTHPATETRIAALRKALPKALALYERSPRFGKGVALAVPRCDQAGLPGAGAPPPPPASPPKPAPPSPTPAGPARPGRPG